MPEVTYGTNQDGDETACFPDTAGDVVCVTNLGGSLTVECFSSYGDELLTPYLDAPRVDALQGLLTRWRETGRLKP